jgi:CheY-like chemotaxis protein
MVEEASILVVEDSPEDFELTKDLLERQQMMRFRIAWEREPTPALRRVVADRFDAILLDYGLGPHDGLEVLRAARAAGVRTPFVVLTGFASADVDMAAMRAGAVDFVPKDRRDPLLLERAIRYAIERQRLLDEVEVLRLKKEQAAELQALDRLPPAEAATATARAYGLGPLRETAGKQFEESVKAYTACLEQALQERTYKIEKRVPGMLRSLGRELGFLGASARDVVDVHTAALREAVEGAPPRKVQVFLEEGRLLLVELMGHLVTYYRLGRQRIAGADDGR